MNSNLAHKDYDMQRFDERAKVAKAAEIKAVGKKQEVPRVKTFKVLFVLLLVIACCGAYLYGSVRLNELNSELSGYNKQLELLENEKVRLEMSLDQKMSLKNIEEYAKQELGLEKLHVNQIEYLTLSEGNKTVVSKEEEPNIVEVVINYIKDLWNK